MVAHPLKIFTVALGLALALSGGALSTAHAFTETPVAPPAGQAAPADPKLQIENVPDGGLSLTTPGTDAGGGTELTIPGVGSIGKVPKLDFGLELLYGGNGQGGDAPAEDQKDDVLIKGKIKHRF